MSANAGWLTGSTPAAARARGGNRMLERAGRTVRRQPLAVAAGIGLLLLTLLAVLGPALPLPDPEAQSLRDRLSGPLTRDQGGTLHLVGTDQLGRDVLSRVVHGARLSLGVALATVAISGVGGSLLGLVAGYRGGLVDLAIMRVVDLQMAFPPLLFALFLLYLLGATLVNLVVLLAVLGWVAFARVARAETLRVKQQPYVEAATAVGCTTTRVLLRHVLPQLLPVLLVVAVFDVAGVILAEAGLSYLGLGVQPPNPSWGVMIAEGQRFIFSGAWWLFATPACAIFMTVLLARMTASWGQGALGHGR